MKRLVGAGFAEGTLEMKRTSFDHTQRFIQYKYHIHDKAIDNLNYEFIEGMH